MENKLENSAAGAAVLKKTRPAANAGGQPPQAARPQGREGALQTKLQDMPVQALEARLRAEFAQTLRVERERAEREKQQTASILRKERAEAAAAIALTRAGARSLKAARALLEVDPAGFEGEQDAEAFAAGLHAQIDKLKAGEDTSFLFAPQSTALRGFIPAEGRDEPFGDTPAAMSLGDAVRRALSPGE